MLPVAFGASPHHRHPHSLIERIFAAGFVSVWLFCWSFFVLFFDIVHLTMIVKTCWSWTYPSVAGTITQSEVVQANDSDGPFSSRPRLKYNYLVNGQNFVGDRLSYLGTGLLDSLSARRLVQERPVGQEVDVFYNPHRPDDAVLERQLDGGPLFLALFWAPFNMVMVGGWWWVFHKTREDSRLPMRRQGDCWLVRRFHGQPFVMALIVVGGMSFVGAFVGAFGGWSQSLLATTSTWIVILSVTVLAYWHTGLSANSVLPSLIINEHFRTLTWPADATSTREFTIAASQLRSINIDESPSSDSHAESRPDYSVLLAFVTDDGQIQKRVALKTDKTIDAESLADWLHAWAGLGQSGFPSAINPNEADGTIKTSGDEAASA